MIDVESRRNRQSIAAAGRTRRRREATVAEMKGSRNVTWYWSSRLLYDTVVQLTCDMDGSLGVA